MNAVIAWMLYRKKRNTEDKIQIFDGRKAGKAEENRN